MDAEAAVAAVDRAELMARWLEKCAADRVLAGLPIAADGEFLEVVLRELELESEEDSELPPSVVEALNVFTETAGSTGVALRQLRALAVATEACWVAVDEALSLKLTRRTHLLMESCMVMSASRALGSLDRSAHVDEATGLGNVRAFRRDLQEALQSEVRPIVVVFADIDGLKAVNDVEGHEAGNAMILAFAEALAESCSAPTSRAYRWGGDEHAVLLVGSSPDDALHLMDQVSLRFDSFSWGVAICPDDGDTVEELMGLSDERMYEAKQARRKSVWRSNPPLFVVAHAELAIQRVRRRLEYRTRRSDRHS